MKSVEQRLTEIENLVQQILASAPMRMVRIQSGTVDSRVTITKEERPEAVNEVDAYAAELRAGDKLANLARELDR